MSSFNFHCVLGTQAPYISITIDVNTDCCSQITRRNLISIILARKSRRAIGLTSAQHLKPTRPALWNRLLLLDEWHYQPGDINKGTKIELKGGTP